MIWRVLAWEESPLPPSRAPPLQKGGGRLLAIASVGAFGPADSEDEEGAGDASADLRPTIGLGLLRIRSLPSPGLSSMSGSEDVFERLGSEQPFRPFEELVGIG